jgi:hypothetical protein
VNKQGTTNGSEGMSVTGVSLTMTGTVIASGTFQVSTGGTALPLGAVSSPGMCFLLNLDSTNYVQLFASSSDTLNPLGRLLAGSPALIPFDPAAVPYLMANTAAVNVSFFLLSQ